MTTSTTAVLTAVTSAAKAMPMSGPKRNGAALISPAYTGRALVILGHAIEYLTENSSTRAGHLLPTEDRLRQFRY